MSPRAGEYIFPYAIPQLEVVAAIGRDCTVATTSRGRVEKLETDKKKSKTGTRPRSHAPSDQMSRQWKSGLSSLVTRCKADFKFNCSILSIHHLASALIFPCRFCCLVRQMHQRQEKPLCTRDPGVRMLLVKLYMCCNSSKFLIASATNPGLHTISAESAPTTSCENEHTMDREKNIRVPPVGSFDALTWCRSLKWATVVHTSHIQNEGVSWCNETNEWLVPRYKSIIKIHRESGHW